MFLHIHENCWIIIAPNVCWNFLTEHPNFYKSPLSHMGDVRELLFFGGEMVGNSHCIMLMMSLLLLLHFYLPRVLVTYQMSNKQLQASTDLFIRQFKWPRTVAVASVIAMCVSIVLSACPIHLQNLNQLLSSRRRRLSPRQTNQDHRIKTQVINIRNARGVINIYLTDIKIIMRYYEQI